MKNHMKKNHTNSITIEIMIGMVVLLGIFIISLSSVEGLVFSSNNLFQDCYQDTANVSTACGGLATGSYSGGTDGGNLSIDANWDTYGNYGFNPITVNYSKPLNATGATWIARDTNHFNVIPLGTLFDHCFTFFPDKVQVQFKYPSFRGTSYYCRDNSGLDNLILGNTFDLNNTYEEAMSWIMNDTISKTTEQLNSSSSRQIFVRYLQMPQNTFVTNAYINLTQSILTGITPLNITYVTVGYSDVNLYVINFSTGSKQKTPNLASGINDYLDNYCRPLNGNCSVPIGFSFLNSSITYLNIVINNSGSVVNSYNVTGLGEDGVFETAMTEFNLNISYDRTRYPLSYAKLYYCDNLPCTVHPSSTTYRTDGATFYSTFALPVINESRFVNYYWDYVLSDGTTETHNYLGYNGTDYTLDFPVGIYDVAFSYDECETEVLNELYNFSTYDEISLKRISPFTFKGTFNFWLGDGSVKKNISVQNLSTNQVSLCVALPTLSVWMDANIQYSDVNNTGYFTRNYYYDNKSVNKFGLLETPIPENVYFYLLNKTISTSFIEDVFDNNNLPFVGGLIYSNRWYPGEGRYRTVEISRTDTSGSTVAQFETETPDYQFNITRKGITYLSTIDQKIVPTAVPYTIQFYLGQNLQAPWGIFLNKTGFSYSGPTLDNNTHIVSFSYTDTTGVTNYVRMVVSQMNPIASNDIICDVNSTLTLATLTCDTTGYNGTIQTDVYLSRSPESPVITTIFIIVQTIRDTMGRMGYFLGWLIIISGFMISIYNPTVGIITGNIACWFVWFTGLISFGPIYLFALLGLSIWIIAELRT